MSLYIQGSQRALPEAAKCGQGKILQIPDPCELEMLVLLAGFNVPEWS